MLFYTGLLLLVIAVSLDGFGVGVSYGMRKIHVPLSALCIIMLCSGIVVLTSMSFGNMISSFISPEIANMLGGAILITLGIFSLINTIRSQLQTKEIVNEEVNEDSTKLNNLKTVLATPDKADLDQSGTISASEAFLLGTALALDAFGAGIGAAIIGYSPILTAILIALMSGVFVRYGIKIGVILSNNKKMQRMSFVPPALLIALGILNLI
ncbi:putative sporulation protein YtaF [Oceanobacillus limi]|uniref:Putative sporulation protein YtaF n=1 Tax=Oceanobacillus limi TaxID=930131 RepID=A0A1I0FP63_9BACI|nr:sporulation membrane protein YtaF [Oceanobacillus limi]SET60140.1 putative sporulation protein YtaF [Oceanobacillus limi]